MGCDTDIWQSGDKLFLDVTGCYLVKSIFKYWKILHFSLQMQAQLKVLQDQLQKEEKEKASVLEQLQQAQEQLTQTATQVGFDFDFLRAWAGAVA